MKLIYILLIISLIFPNKLESKILVLSPYTDIDEKKLDSSDISTIYTLFVNGLDKHISNIELSSLSCINSECALDHLSKTNNDEIIYTKIQKLGQKFIFSASILDNNNEFTSSATAMSIEDMDQVCLRLSKSIAFKETFEESADIENITQKEEEEPLRRQSISRIGMGLGYLFPFSDTGDENISQSIYFGTNYYYEFKNNTALLLEFGMGMPFFGLDLSFLKFTNIIDTSPFYGLGIGLYDSYDSNNRNTNTYNHGHTTQTQESSSGIGLSLQGGVMLYRTYNINVIARAKYLVVTNSDIDNGLILDIKFQRNIPEKKNRTVYRYPLLEMILGR
tara:strand:+ start:1779 stop:2780 length:1002 start_codon:yes stop_codon:yes gene_type:complete